MAKQSVAKIDSEMIKKAIKERLQVDAPKISAIVRKYVNAMVPRHAKCIADGLFNATRGYLDSRIGPISRRLEALEPMNGPLDGKLSGKISSYSNETGLGTIQCDDGRIGTVAFHLTAYMGSTEPVERERVTFIMDAANKAVRVERRKPHAAIR